VKKHRWEWREKERGWKEGNKIREVVARERTTLERSREGKEPAKRRSRGGVMRRKG